MELPSYFDDFLSEIRPRKDQLVALRSGHKTLRKRLREDEGLAPIYVSDFLQGSYRRSTAVRPLGDEKADVDVIVVTNLDSKKLTPDEALDLFEPFLNTHYKGQWTRNGRSIGIELVTFKLDLVVTAAPSEVQKELYKSASIRTLQGIEDLKEWRLVPSWPDSDSESAPGYFTRLTLAKSEPEWKLEPLLIPDRDAEEWQPTNPIAQIKWTWDKNKICNSYYVSVVKAIKWWRRQYEKPKYPKSYPLEHLIGDCCPDDLSSVAAGVTGTLESIVAKYQSYADSGQVPFLCDHGVDQDVFKRVTPEDFADFCSLVKDAAVIARQALDSRSEAESAAAWRSLFGGRFPEGPDEGEKGGPQGGSQGGFTPRSGPSIITGGRFA
ncbi:MAG: SMODS domain-containing nucleotidyltransferase [Thermoanaerobaculia bacterium]